MFPSEVRSTNGNGGNTSKPGSISEEQHTTAQAPSSLSPPDQPANISPHSSYPPSVASHHTLPSDPKDLLPPPPKHDYALGAPLISPSATNLDREPEYSAPTPAAEPIQTEQHYVPDLYSSNGVHPIQLNEMADHTSTDRNTFGGHQDHQDHDESLAHKVDGMTLDERLANEQEHDGAHGRGENGISSEERELQQHQENQANQSRRTSLRPKSVKSVAPTHYTTKEYAAPLNHADAESVRGGDMGNTGAKSFRGTDAGSVRSPEYAESQATRPE